MLNSRVIFTSLMGLLVCISCQKKQAIPIPSVKESGIVELPHIIKNAKEDFDPYFFETMTITSKEGPQSITRNIIQDDKGDFWFATWEGIMKYDGNEYTNFTNKNKLRRYHVFSVYQDRRGEYWFGTVRAGLYRYDGKKFTNLTAKDVLPHDIVLNFYEDSKDNLWIATSGGLVKYDGQEFISYTEKDGLKSVDVNSIVEDKDGRLWIGTRGVLYNYKDGAFSEYRTENGNSFNNARTIIKDRKDRIWIGGNDGIWVFDGENRQQLTTNFCGYLYEDRKGRVYAGTVEPGVRDWKLWRFEDAPLPLKEIEATHIKDQEGQIFGIIEDNDGKIWYGHETGVFELVMNN